MKPVPGTRPEYTPVAEHYRVDIDLTPPSIDASSWRLRISGLVARPLQLTIGQLRGDYAKRDQFITLECISNPIGGPLIGTTLWSGPSLRDVLATAQPRPGANYAHMLSQDGFDEVVALTTVQADQRVILAYDWNGQPLPTAHGFPLRVYIPDLYGMKQPKWITDIVLVPDFIPGYWVKPRLGQAGDPPHHLGDRHGGDERPAEARRPDLRAGRRHRRRRRRAASRRSRCRSTAGRGSRPSFGSRSRSSRG